MKLNQIIDLIPLSRLTKLNRLVLAENYYINDIDVISKLANLVKLDLMVCKISNIKPLSGLKKLTWLGLYSNRIRDINALSNLTNLSHLDLAYNLVDDISALSGLTSLEYVGLLLNQITDLSPLVENSGISGSIDISTQSETNPLNNMAYYIHIPELKARGINVNYFVPEDVVLFKDANLEKAIRDAA